MPQEQVKFWGAPGTGKTGKLLRVVDQELGAGVRPEEIIYTSFTRAACGEAVRRACIQFGLSKESFPYFRTEHSICFRLLKLSRDQVFGDEKLAEFTKLWPMYSFSGGKAAPNWADQRFRPGDVMLKTAGDYLEFFVSWMKNMMLPFEQAFPEFKRHQTAVPDEFTYNSVLAYLERRNQYKQEHALWDFADMLIGALESHACPPVKVLIADEMQDGSPLLWELIRFWSTKVERTYIAGDPYQALYQFAGASPELFLNFPAELEVLEHSWRLTPQTKKFAEAILATVGLTMPSISTEGKTGSLIRQALASIDWDNIGDTFLLARSRYQLSLLRDELIARGIPFVIERGLQNPLVTSEGRAYECLMKLDAGEAVSSTLLRSLATHTSAPWLKHGAKTRIKELAEGSYKLSQLRDLLGDDTIKEVKAEGPAAILTRGVEEMSKSYLGRVARKYGLSAFTGEPRVLLTTMHGSKGREAETVIICPELTRKIYDSLQTNRESEALVAYVAATRSSKNLIILPQEGYRGFNYPRIEE